MPSPDATDPPASGESAASRRWRPLLFVALAHVLSRAAFLASGVAFDYDTPATHWQFLDPRQLEANLGESLTYLHAQPPLLNMLYGALAKLSPGDGGLGLATAIFLALGAAASVSVYHLVARLASARVAAVATALFALSPAAVLFESYFFYTHLVMAGLALAAAALERYLATSRWPWLAAMFAALAAVALTRTSFHLVWLAAIAIGLALLLRGRRATALALGAVALAVVGAWYAKNAVLFGRFTASSWVGMNLTRFVTNGLSDGEVAALVRSGRVSPVYYLSPFATVEEYASHVELPPPTGVPVLDEPRKAGGAPNYNHLVYLGLSERYGADSLRVLAEHPEIVVANQPDTWLLYFQPSSQYFHFIRAVFARSGLHGTNVDAVAGWERGFNAAVGLQFVDAPSERALLGYHRPEFRAAKLATASWTAVGGTLLVLVAGPWLAWRRRPDAPLVLFLWFNVLYVAAVANTLEVGENQRFRFETEALWWVLACACLAGILEGSVLSRRRARAAPGALPSRGPDRRAVSGSGASRRDAG